MRRFTLQPGLIRLVGMGALVLASFSFPCIAQDLDRDVQSLHQRAKLGSATVGVSVVDVESGTALAGLHEDDRFAPASNMKLITTGAALAVFGSDHEFQTRLLRHGSRVVIVGSGDPALADPELLKSMGTSLDSFLDRLADGVREGGLSTVSEIIVDDRVFDRQYVHPDWPTDQLDSWYCAEVCGLNFHANVLSVFASPGRRAGEPAIVRTEPSGGGEWLEISTKARTVASGSTSFWAARDGLSNRFTIRGSVRTAPIEPIEATMHEASLVLAQLLADRLAGNTVMPPCRLAEIGESLGDAGKVLAMVRTPMSVVLERCNVDSHNLYAESLLKAMAHTATGQPGSWTGGAAAVRMQLRDRLGPDSAAGVFIADGSGLARTNQVTPAIMTAWLAAIAKDPRIGDTFVSSLPRSGVDGKLAKRFQRKKPANEVRCKTGMINGVLCLSGYITHEPSSRRLAFSVLVNDIPPSVSGARVKEFHEDIVLLADRLLTNRCKAIQEREAVGG